MEHITNECPIISSIEQIFNEQVNVIWMLVWMGGYLSNEEIHHSLILQSYNTTILVGETIPTYLGVILITSKVVSKAKL